MLTKVVGNIIGNTTDQPTVENIRDNTLFERWNAAHPIQTTNFGDHPRGTWKDAEWVYKLTYLLAGSASSEEEQIVENREVAAMLRLLPYKDTLQGIGIVIPTSIDWRLVSIGEDDRRYFQIVLAQPLAEGERLAVGIQKQKNLEDRVQLANIVIPQVFIQMGALLSLGIFHRDVTPDNLIHESTSGKLSLIDFGHAISNQEHVEIFNSYPVLLISLVRHLIGDTDELSRLQNSVEDQPGIHSLIVLMDTFNSLMSIINNRRDHKVDVSN